MFNPIPHRSSFSFKVLRMARRAGGWEITARFGVCRYRRYWMDSDAPSRQKLRADFVADPDRWAEID